MPNLDVVVAKLTVLSEDLMPDSFTVNVAGTFTPDGIGGGSVTSAPARGPYPARKGVQGDQEEAETGGQFRVLGSEVMRFPKEVALRPEEHGTYSVAETGETFGFEVLYVAPLATYSAHRRAIIRRT